MKLAQQKDSNKLIASEAEQQKSIDMRNPGSIYERLLQQNQRK
jgi:hypothetical protein